MNFYKLIAAAALFISITCNAQFDPLDGKGVKPYGNYDFSGVGTVNVVNGNLNIDINLLTFKQAGTLPPLEIHFISDTESWDEIQTGFDVLLSPGTTTSGPTVSRIVANLATYTVDDWTADLNPHDPQNPEDVYYGAARDWRGFKHPLAEGSGLPVDAIDGSGLRVSADRSQIFDRQGNVYPFASNTVTSGILVQDRFGNQISLSGGTVTDSLSRSIPANLAYPNQSWNGAAGCKTSYFPGPPPGGSGSLIVCQSLHSLSTNFGVDFPGSNIVEYRNSMTLIDSITLPNGKQWTFTYNSYGDLFAITMPTGGSASFTYESYRIYPGDGAIALGRRVTSKTVDDANGNSAVWRYSYTTTNGTIVSDPQNNDTVYRFDTVYHYNGAYNSGSTAGSACPSIAAIPNDSLLTSNLIRVDVNAKQNVDYLLIGVSQIGPPISFP